MFFRVLPLFAVIACVPPAQDGSSAEDVDFLLDNHEGFPERARVLEGASGRFEEGEWFEGSSLSDRVYTVTQLSDRAVQVHHRTYNGIELLTWVEHRDLALTTPVPTFTHGQTGMRLPAGVELQVQDASADEVRVAYRSRVAEVDAWMPREQLDVYWIEEPERAPFDAAWDGHALAPDTELFDGPDGERVGWIRALHDDRDDPFHSVELVERWEEWARVRGDTDLYFDAWVHAADLHEANVGFGFGWSHSFGCGGHGYLAGPANVAGGALLHATPDGQVVGRTTQDVRLSLEEHPDGWASARLQTPLGEAEIWVAPSERLDGA